MILNGFIVFICTWWMVFFMLLPIGNKPEEEPELGHAASAPANPRTKMKMLWTTGIAILLTILIYVLINMDLISFEDMAREMHEEDKLK